MRPAKYFLPFAAFMILAFSLAGGQTGMGAPALQQQQGEETFFYANGEKIPVILALDEIGVIAQEGAGQTGLIAELAAAFNLDVGESYPGGLFLFLLPEPIMREEITDLMRMVREEGLKQQIIKEAGLILYILPDESTPVLVPDLFVAQFDANIPREEVEAYNKENGVETVGMDPFIPNQYLLLPAAGNPLDSLALGNRYEEAEIVLYAHPDLWQLEERLETIPTDPLFGNQWHHRNTGASGGTVDADADTSWAWDINTGNANTVIAVIDDGFDIAHEDLAPNLFTNAGEIPGNGTDDDGNGYIDDVNGWDVVACAASPGPGCGDNDPSPGGAGDNHGSAVAGVALARSGNSLGVSGSCPNCQFLPIRRAYGVVPASAVAAAFGYAQTLGVDIINNSWGHSSPAGVVPTALATAINNAAAADIMIFFAAGNGNSSGWCAASYPSLNTVLAVSSSTNLDRKVNEAAFGNCVDILAPSHRGYNPPYNGTLNVTTTDRTGIPGYNSASPPPLTCAIAEPGDTNYTHCFGGTSSASPLAAGIAGLIRSANAGLTRTQVQNLIQDTADKIEPGLADYQTTNGFSSPGGGVATHSFGRTNAYEAVHIAAPATQGGKAGVDIFLRDNRLDWGNTTGYLGQQPSNVLFEPVRGFIGHWRSEDIKVDAPPYQPAPTNNAQFEAFTHENPKESQLNKVYVRVRNRGPVTAAEVTVKLHWTFAGTGLPALPADFWTAFPGDSIDTSKVHPLGVKTISNLAYSGSSVAGTAGDAAQIVSFDFMAPAIDPTQPNPDHYCLFAVLDSPQDSIDPQSEMTFVIDIVTPNDNNVTHRNLKLEETSGGDGSYLERFYVRNPFNEPIQSLLLLDAPDAQRLGWQISLSNFEFGTPFEMQPGEEVLVELQVLLDPGEEGEVTVMQQRVDTTDEPLPLGGMTYLFQSVLENSLYLPLVLK